MPRDSYLPVDKKEGLTIVCGNFIKIKSFIDMTKPLYFGEIRNTFYLLICSIFVLVIFGTNGCLKSKGNFKFRDKDYQTYLLIDETNIYLDSISIFENIEINIPFENIGSKLLKISAVNVDCSCTVPRLPTRTILPSQKDTIRISFKPVDLGAFSKTISIISNNFEGVITIIISGYVVSDNMSVIHNEN